MAMVRAKKRTADSLTTMTKVLQYRDINGENRLFGGRLMEWIDETATICGMRHCGGCVTTRAVDNLQFRRGAVLNDIVVLRACVTYVGRTSIEVRVESFTEARSTGERTLINRAYLIVVHVDENGVPQPVPFDPEPTTEEEKAEYRSAERRS